MKHSLLSILLFVFGSAGIPAGIDIFGRFYKKKFKRELIEEIPEEKQKLRDNIEMVLIWLGIPSYFFALKGLLFALFAIIAWSFFSSIKAEHYLKTIIFGSSSPQETVNIPGAQANLAGSQHVSTPERHHVQIPSIIHPAPQTSSASSETSDCNSEPNFESARNSGYAALKAFYQSCPTPNEVIASELSAAFCNYGSKFDTDNNIDLGIESENLAIKADSENANAHSNLGKMYIEGGYIDEGIEQLREALNLNPDLDMAHYNLANALNGEEEYRAAVQEYQAAIQISPDFYQAYNNLGNAYESLGSYQEAINALRKAVSIDENRWDAYNGLCNVYRHMKEYNEAISFCQIAIKINPNDAISYNNWGAALYSERDYSAALNQFQTAQSIDPGNATIQYNVNLAKSALENPPLTSPSSTTPQNQIPAGGIGNRQDSAVNGAASLDQQGDAAFSKKDYSKAFSLYTQAAEQGDAEAENDLGSLYFWGEGVKQDYTQSMMWDQKSADQGNKTGELLLGSLYSNGEGVPVNNALAEKYFLAAANQGGVYEEDYIADFYGAIQNYSQEMVWYKKAAEQGDKTAEFNLAMMYYRGEGTTQNIDQAIYWFKKDAAQGDPDGESEVESIYALKRDGLAP